RRRRSRTHARARRRARPTATTICWIPTRAGSVIVSPQFGGGAQMQMSLGRRSIAEMVGTFWLVLGGCGSAVLAASFPGLGIGFAGVALAFGLSVLTMAYALGGISGAHFNPAV